MRLRHLLLPLVAVAAMTFGIATPSYAYSANSWYPHPTITSNWKCGATVDMTVLSVQRCFIVTATTAQPVTIVRNRLATATRRASVEPLRVSIQYANSSTVWYSKDFNCRTSALAANDYSGCFGETVTGLDTSKQGMDTTSTVIDRQAAIYEDDTWWFDINWRYPGALVTTTP